MRSVALADEIDLPFRILPADVALTEQRERCIRKPCFGLVRGAVGMPRLHQVANSGRTRDSREHNVVFEP